MYDLAVSGSECDAPRIHILDKAHRLAIAEREAEHVWLRVHIEQSVLLLSPALSDNNKGQFHARTSFSAM
jgi:hypothetical protein